MRRFNDRERQSEALAATVCAIPIIGSRFELCHATGSSPPPKPFNVEKVATAQNALVVAVSRVGRNHRLSWQMLHHQFALREMLIRVGFSGLKQKRDLEHSMELLKAWMEAAADNLSRFGARLGTAVDGTRTFDEYIIRELEKRSSLPQPTSSPFASIFPTRAIAAISPIAAWSALQGLETENRVKALISALSRDASETVMDMINSAGLVITQFDKIQAELDKVKKTVTAEFGNLEPNNTFYVTASALMRDTWAAFVQARTQLDEFKPGFDGKILPGLLVQQPVELIVGTLRESIKRLADGHENFEAAWAAMQNRKFQAGAVSSIRHSILKRGLDKGRNSTTMGEEAHSEIFREGDDSQLHIEFFALLAILGHKNSI
ncbi:hypothetical protein VTK26DRAFT_1950 [Humicola hyalothermophila]